MTATTMTMTELIAAITGPARPADIERFDALRAAYHAASMAEWEFETQGAAQSMRAPMAVALAAMAYAVGEAAEVAKMPRDTIESWFDGATEWQERARERA